MFSNMYVQCRNTITHVNPSLNNEPPTDAVDCLLSNTAVYKVLYRRLQKQQQWDKEQQSDVY